jgi:hypothetical protein
MLNCFIIHDQPSNYKKKKTPWGKDTNTHVYGWFFLVQGQLCNCTIQLKEKYVLKHYCLTMLVFFF